MSTTSSYPINYNLGNHITSKGVTVETSEGFKFELIEALKDPEDVVVDNYTNMFLTKKGTLSTYFEDNLKHKTQNTSLPKQFTTYLAPSIGPEKENKKYLAVYAADGKSTTQVACSGYNAEIAEINSSDLLKNPNFFEIESITGTKNLIRIKHYDTRKTVYLTYSHITGRVYFDTPGAPSLSSGAGGCFSFTSYAVQRTDPQVFEYILDNEVGYIKIYKWGLSVTGKKEYKMFTVGITSGSDTSLSVVEENWDSSQDLDAIFATGPIFKAELPITLTTSDITSRISAYKNLNLNINKPDSITDTTHNFLFHNEPMSTATGSNVVTLKNQLPNSFEQTVNNLIPGSNKADYRDYTCIAPGDKNLPTAIYNDYTAQVILPADKITYFHLPIETYPYKRLYIGDAGLVQAGAIPGDRPVTSDKIFKKKANYNKSTPSGEPTGDLTGKWLCSWLWSPSGIESAIWVDRYYDSNTYSYTRALKTYVNTIYEDLVELKNASSINAFKRDIFDVKSSLVFEPNTYYAYHHIGNTDIDTYIKTEYADNIIVDEFRTLSLDNEYTYKLPKDTTGENGINLSFLLERSPDSSWSDPIGYHILGNYSNKGVSVYNRLDVTPLIYSITEDKKHINIYNNDLVLVAEIGREAPDPSNVEVLVNSIILDYAIFEPLGNITCLRQSESSAALYLYEYTHDGAIVEFTHLKEIKGTFHDARFFDGILYILTTEDMYTVDLATESVVVSQLPDPAPIWKKNNALITKSDLVISEDKREILRSGDGKLKFRDATGSIKVTEQDQDNYTIIIFQENNKDYMIAFDDKNNHLFEPIEIPTSASTETYSILCITDFSTGVLEKYYTIVQQKSNKAVLYKYTRTGSLISSVTFDEGTQWSKETTFKNFSNDFAKFGVSNKLYFKQKLINILDKDDHKSITIELDLPTELTRTEHAISYNYDPQKGKSTVYIDGTRFAEKILNPENPVHKGKYVFTNLYLGDIKIGSSPYTNNTDISAFMKQPVPFKGNSKFTINALKIFNTSLSQASTHFLLATLSKGSINDIIWTIPYTKRHFADEINKMQSHLIPGIKSNKMGIHLHTNLDIGNELKSDINNIVDGKIKEFIPSNVNLQPVEWI
jgi:hypothetical protein